MELDGSVRIVDCGLGNAGAVVNMLAKAGASAVLTAEPDALSDASSIVLPGVGAFDAGVERLHATGMWEAVRSFAATGRPVLGICLGMQLLGRRSEEGSLPGLSLIDAEFTRLSRPGLKVPHTGWNVVRPVTKSKLFPQTTDELRFYFVHSYVASLGPLARPLATSVYGHEFVCSYSQGNVYGVQFHPEKSHRFGLALLKRFAASDA